MSYLYNARIMLLTDNAAIVATVGRLLQRERLAMLGYNEEWAALHFHHSVPVVLGTDVPIGIHGSATEGTLWPPRSTHFKGFVRQGIHLLLGSCKAYDGRGILQIFFSMG